MFPRKGSQYMSVDQQLMANRLEIAVLAIDLQAYKGSVYQLRWASPGGLDRAIPAYEDAARTIAETAWPDDLRSEADSLHQLLDSYIGVLRSRDITQASTLATRLAGGIEMLRAKVREWPAGGEERAGRSA
jgi:hypothetical protein